jgi:hypothetical protein
LTFILSFIYKNHQPEPDDEAEDLDETLSLSSAEAATFV